MPVPSASHPIVARCLEIGQPDLIVMGIQICPLCQATLFRDPSEIGSRLAAPSCTHLALAANEERESRSWRFLLTRITTARCSPTLGLQRLCSPRLGPWPRKPLSGSMWRSTKARIGAWTRWRWCALSRCGEWKEPRRWRLPGSLGRFIGALGVPDYYFEDAAMRPQCTFTLRLRK